MLVNPLFSELPVTSTLGMFNLGQAIKTRIIKVDLEQSRIYASIRQTASSFELPASVDQVEKGNVLDGEVTAIHKDNVVVSLHPSKVKALLSLQNLANFQQLNVNQLRSSLAVGETLHDLAVVSVNEEKQLVIVIMRPKKKSAALDKSITIDNVEIGQVLTGLVVGQKSFGTSLRLSARLFGRLNPTDASDNYTANPDRAFPADGNKISVVVVGVDKENKHVEVSTRPSRLSKDSSEEVVDKEVASLEDLKVGAIVRGFVKNIASNGLFVTIGRGITARVQIKELFDEVN